MSASLKILVVDDEALIAMLTEDVLRDRFPDAEICVAHDYQDAIATMSRMGGADVIVSDWNYPGKDRPGIGKDKDSGGKDLYDFLARHNDQTPIVYVSGRSSEIVPTLADVRERVVADAASRGVDVNPRVISSEDVLTKPVRDYQLVDAVERALSGDISRDAVSGPSRGVKHPELVR